MPTSAKLVVNQAPHARDDGMDAVVPLFDAAPIGIFLVDADLRIRVVNAAARPIFADSPDLIGSNFSDVIHSLWSAGTSDVIVEIFRHTLETGESYTTPERMVEARGRGITGHFEWQVRRIDLPDGRFGVACYVRDITDQVVARAAVAESVEERRRTAEGLRAIAARARCLLWYAEVEDVGDRFLHWKQRVADEEAAHRFLPVLVLPDHTYTQALGEARLPEDRVRMAWGDDEVRAGHSYQQEFRVRDAAGRIRWLAEDVQIEAIGPHRWNAVGICVDITDRKRAEEEQARHSAEIESLNRRLQRAMTETHHRVKNNLQLISALIDMQRSTLDDMMPASEFTRLSANVRALSVIHDILTQEAKAGSDQESLSVKAVLDQLIQALEQTTGGRPIVAEIEDARLAGRQATTLALVTNELVSNALKHGKGQTEIQFTTEGNMATFAVCDDGPGFPPGFDGKTAANTGLQLVEHIAGWDLQGKISYDNRPEGGARITVTFPIAREK